MDAGHSSPAPGAEEAQTGGRSRRPAWFRRAGETANRLASSKVARTVVTLAILAIAALLIRAELASTRLADVMRAIAATPPWAMGLCLVFTAASYGCGAMVEWYALRFIGKPLPLGRTALAAAGASAVSIAMGFGLASGTAARLRFYAFAHLSAADVAKVTGLVSAAIFITGLATLGLAGLGDLGAVAVRLHWPFWCVALLSALLLGLLPGWFLLLKRWPGHEGRALRGGGRALCLAAGIGNWMFQGAALFVLTARSLADFPAVLSAFSFGALIGSVLGVPADLGVLDATVLGSRSLGAAHQTAAALVLFRLIYQALPLTLATAALTLRPMARAVRKIAG